MSRAEKRVLTRAFGWTAMLAAVAVASASVPLSAQNTDVRGAWNAERYIMKAGAEHRVDGRIFFTESDWQVVFFVVDEEGEIKRGSAEGGTYTLEGDALTFWHLHNFSTGEAMEGLEEAPLRMVYRDLEPNYHQASDRLSTINHQLVAEVSRTTVATIMLLALSPARLSGLEVRRSRVGVQLTWAAAAESGVEDYRLRYTRADGSEAEEQVTTLAGEAPRALLEDVLTGSQIGVKAVNRRGLEGWDWAWITVP